MVKIMKEVQPMRNLIKLSIKNELKEKKTKFSRLEILTTSKQGKNLMLPSQFLLNLTREIKKRNYQLESKN